MRLLADNPPGQEQNLVDTVWKHKIAADNWPAEE